MRFSPILSFTLAASAAVMPRQMGGGGSAGAGVGVGESGSGSAGSVTTTSFSASASASASAASSATKTTATTFTSAATQSTTTDTACNNAVSLCDRKYNNVTHMGAHDSSFLRDASTSYSLAGTQYYNATWALDAGIRLLQVQVHVENDTLRMCHTSCALLDAGTLEAWLGDVKAWMDGNPNEVVTLLMVNSDDAAASVFGEVFEGSGIAEYGYTPASTSATTEWPTLRTMIEANTRLVSFIAAIDYNSTYPYLLNEWDYMFETSYEVLSLSGFNCTIDRPSSLTSASAAVASGYLPLVNHFVYKQYTLLTYNIEIPNADLIDTTNSPATNTTGTLGTHGAQCKEEYEQRPVFMLVDFWNRGASVETADALNGVTGETTGRSHTDLENSGGATTASAGGRGTVERGRMGSSFALGVVCVVALMWGV